jgi:hypothetical protein
VSAAAERDRAALAKVLADVEGLASDAAMLLEIHAEGLAARRLATLLSGARAARKRLAWLVDHLPADTSGQKPQRQRAGKGRRIGGTS